MPRVTECDSGFDVNYYLMLLCHMLLSRIFSFTSVYAMACSILSLNQIDLLPPDKHLYI